MQCERSHTLHYVIYIRDNRMQCERTLTFRKKNRSDWATTGHMTRGVTGKFFGGWGVTFPDFSRRDFRLFPVEISILVVPG